MKWGIELKGAKTIGHNMIEEGSSVPKFGINDADGNKVKSTDFKGKKHVIYFYPKDFTPGCSTQADEFSTEYKKFQKEGIEVIGISTDDVKAAIEAAAAEAQAKVSANTKGGALPKGFEAKAEPEPAKSSKGTLPKGF